MGAVRIGPTKVGRPKVTTIPRVQEFSVRGTHYEETIQGQ